MYTKIFFQFKGSTPNPAFNNFQRHIESVARPESQLNIDIGSSFIWNDYLPTPGNYFAYPGSYTAADNSRIYNCATVIVQPLSTASPFISRQQVLAVRAHLHYDSSTPVNFLRQGQSFTNHRKTEVP